LPTRNCAAASPHAAAISKPNWPGCRPPTDYIDLYWAHYDDPDVPLQETAGAFDALVRAGKVRAIGELYTTDSVTCTG
jgi:Aldo/keto reductase family